MDSLFIDKALDHSRALPCGRLLPGRGPEDHNNFCQNDDHVMIRSNKTTSANTARTRLPAGYGLWVLLLGLNCLTSIAKTMLNRTKLPTKTVKE
ncbi:hypothetical protein KC878_04275 [Candidatus Saccharibacteria bacterium]|nr:hypothetical protein [Candidatus Saccharibacteria bacterium]MCB9821464.1 hypothetical protein [Candidatus Nomurabacteria bacterium]